MKIAQVVSLAESVPPKSKNGLEFVVSWLTEELVKRGHEVTLFAPKNSQTKAKLISLFPNGTTHRSELVWDWDGRDFSEWNTALAISKEKDFDIIHTHVGTIFKFMPFAKKPIVYTIHGPYNDEFRLTYLKERKYRKCFDFVLKQYKKVNFVTVSKKQEKGFKQVEDYYFKKYITIYNGIPINKFSYNSQPQDYLLYVGYINHDKGADIAIQVVRKIGMKLILAGEYNRKEPAFFNKFIKPYLNKNIKYIGSVSFKEKNKLLGNARAVLNPVTWYEPFGLVPLEAQACGTPVVAFNKGAMPEIIQHNKTGFVVKTEKEMIGAIKKIDKINRKDCREWVEQNFTVEKMVDNYEKLYRKLTNK